MEGRSKRLQYPRQFHTKVQQLVFVAAHFGVHDSLQTDTNQSEYASVAKLPPGGRTYLFGQDEHSWALCFGRGTRNQVKALHNGVGIAAEDAGEHSGK